MAITAQNVIDRVQDILQDDGVRWTEAELLRWLNDGQREICVYKPDACVVNEVVALSAGTKQTLPSGGTTLISATRNFNNTTAGNAVRLIDKRILDDQIPNWHTVSATSVVTHYCFDPRNQKNFYVYPPSTGGGTAEKLEIIYAKAPTDMTANSTLGASGFVDEIYANALIDYICYRAYNKDVDYAADDTRAGGHYKQFVQALVGKEQGESASEALAALRRANSAPVQTYIPSGGARQ